MINKKREKHKDKEKKSNIKKQDKNKIKKRGGQRGRRSFPLLEAR